jgi:hypothetical protein
MDSANEARMQTAQRPGLSNSAGNLSASELSPLGMMRPKGIDDNMSANAVAVN